MTGPKLGAGTVVSSKLGTITSRVNSVSIPNGDIGATSVTCLPGEIALSGGANWTTLGPDQLTYLFESYRSAPGTWSAAGLNGAAVPLSFHVFAYCLAP